MDYEVFGMNAVYLGFHWVVKNFKLKPEFMFTPITIDKFVRIHLRKNPGMKESVLRVRIEAAIDDYRNGVKCKCGKDIWVVGSASAPFACFSCISGKDYPRGDYEIDGTLDKRDKFGRRNINEMDPRQIAGIFDDEGYEILPDSIKMPLLCLSCIKIIDPDWEDKVLCNLQRFGAMESETFECGEYRKI